MLDKCSIRLIQLALLLLIATMAGAQPSLQVTLISPRQDERIAGKPLIIQARAISAAKQARVYVTAVLTYPGGAMERIPLTEDDLTDSDIAGNGVFLARVERLRVPGDYLLRAKVWNDGREAWSNTISFTYLPANPLSLPSATRNNAAWFYLLLCGLLSIQIVALLILLLKRQKIPATATASHIEAVITPAEAIAPAAPISTSTVVGSENVIKEIRRLRTEMGAIAEAVHDSHTTANEDLHTLRLELESTRNAIEAWQETAIDYFETLQRGIEEYGEEDPRGKALTRDAAFFARFCAARGFERITAQPGDPLVDGLFQVIEEEITDDVPAETILRCVEWGYRSGTIVHKRAKVVLAKAADNESVVTIP